MKPSHLAGLLLLAACSTKPEPRTQLVAEPVATRTPMSGQREHRMANCPTAIDGATTTVINTADGVDVAISSNDPGAQQQIRELSNAQARMGEPVPGDVQNTGRHGGPGTNGHCPIIHDGTAVTVTPTDEGAMLHVKALDPTRVKALQDETAVRTPLPPDVAQQR